MSNPQLIDKARDLRRRMTPAEQQLWRRLRGRRFASFKFRRQHPLDRFILDFFCADARLAIELDGDSHCGKERKDSARKVWIQSNNIKVMTFWNTEIYNNADKVMELIFYECVGRIESLRNTACCPEPASGSATRQR